MQFRTLTAGNLEQTGKQLGLGLSDTLTLLGKLILDTPSVMIDMDTWQKKVDDLLETRRVAVQAEVDRLWESLEGPTPPVQMVNTEEFQIGKYAKIDLNKFNAMVTASKEAAVAVKE